MQAFLHKYGKVLAYLGLTLALFLTLNQFERRDDERQRRAAYSTCERVNLLRAQSNLSDNVIFEILSISAQQQAKLAKAEPKTREIHQKAADLLASEAKKVTVTALTDCDRAIGDPLRYRLSLPRPIGDPMTGELYPEVQAAVDASRRIIAKRNYGIDEG